MAPILPDFDPEYHIRIETNVCGNSIDGIFCQLTWDNLC